MSITERYDYKAMTAIEPYPADAALLKRLSLALEWTKKTR